MKRIKGSLAGYALLVLACLAVNWGGDQIVSRLNWPVWLDSIGTVVCAYVAGPFCGAVVGITTNLLAHILYGIPWFYAIVSVIIAIIVGFAARKRMLDHLLGTLSVGVVLAASTSLAAFVLNSILNNGSTGSAWGDAVKGFLMERGLSGWLSLFIGELYMELADKLLILLVLYIIRRLILGIYFKVHPEKLAQMQAEQEAAKHVTAVLLAIGSLVIFQVIPFEKPLFVALMLGWSLPAPFIIPLYADLGKDGEFISTALSMDTIVSILLFIPIAAYTLA